MGAVLPVIVLGRYRRKKPGVQAKFIGTSMLWGPYGYRMALKPQGRTRRSRGFQEPAHKWSCRLRFALATLLTAVPMHFPTCQHSPVHTPPSTLRRWELAARLLLTTHSPNWGLVLVHYHDSRAGIYLKFFNLDYCLEKNIYHISPRFKFLHKRERWGSP